MDINYASPPHANAKSNPPSDLTRFLSRPWVPIVFFALLTATTSNLDINYARPPFFFSTKPSF